MKLYRTVALGLLCAFTLAANAQWQWLDNNGKKVFSDRPPPSDIPDKNITKRPGGAPAVSAPAQAGASAPSAAAPAALPKPSGKDAALEKKKAQNEAAEAAKKKAEDERIAASKAENCQRAKQSLQSLQSGMRIAQTNAQGEREFMSDEARAAETQRVQGIVNSDCQQ